MNQYNCASNDNFIRQDPISKEWVVFAPYRMKRPHDIDHTRHVKEPLQPYDPNCPFCPGNERSLDTITDEIKNENTDGWYSRAVENKYPVLSNISITQRHREQMYLCMGGYGHHEVIIENPSHNKDIPFYSVEELQSVIEIYQRRYLELMTDKHIVMVTIFRNHGIRAGTSLIHPHSQIIATPTVPQYIRIREQLSEVYFDDNGVCIYCDLIKYESKSALRIITENQSFISFVPYAAKVPFEIWILPKRHTAVFGDIMSTEKTDLSIVLKDIMGRFYKFLDDPDYNYIIHSFTKFRAKEPHLHWYLQIVPRLFTPAGFEMGSGFSVNASLPENDAKQLRDQKLS